MNWAALLEALLAFLAGFTTWLADRQLLEAGAAQSVLASLQSAQDSARRAKEIRRAVRDASAHDPTIVRGADDGAKRQPKG